MAASVKRLALGFAEGTILFKFTSPLVLPLQLWLLVSFFKRQRLQAFLAAAPASCDDSGPRIESPEEVKRVQVKSAEEMGHRTLPSAKLDLPSDGKAARK